MNIKIIKCELDSDFQGLSIARKVYTEIEGSKFYSELQRCSFRKYEKDSQGNVVLNTEFSNQVDQWVGTKDFLVNKFNF